MTPSKPNDKIPHCPGCQTLMICIGNLPRVKDRPWVEVFRCTHCSAVVTRET